MIRPARRRRGKVAAVGAALAAVLLTLVAGAGLFLGRFAEAWHLRRLDSPDFEAALAAASRPGDLRSVKAVPQILRLFTRAGKAEPGAAPEPPLPADFLTRLSGVDPVAPQNSAFFMLSLTARRARTWLTIRAAIQAIGAGAVPGLTGAYRSQETPHDERELAGCELIALLRDLARRGDTKALLRCAAGHDLEGPFRIQAFAALAEVPALPDEALPLLLEALRDEEPFVRMYAARAIGSLGRRAREAVPVLEEMKREGAEAGHHLWEAANDALQSIHRDS